MSDQNSIHAELLAVLEEKNVELSISPEEAYRKIGEVVDKYFSQLLNHAADAIAFTGSAQERAHLFFQTAIQLKEVLEEEGCKDFILDRSLPRDNPASLRYEETPTGPRWTLHCAEEIFLYDPSQVPRDPTANSLHMEKVSEHAANILRELIHEIAALKLLKKLVVEEKTEESQLLHAEVLTVLKNQLDLGSYYRESTGELVDFGLAHAVDAILLRRIENPQRPRT